MTNSQTDASKKASDLAGRILMGAAALEDYTAKLSDSDWQKPVAGDGCGARKGINCFIERRCTAYHSILY